MSGGVQSAGSKCKAEDVDETLETPSWHTVVVSNLGDRRPEESVPNALVNFCLNQGRSTTSYVLVPDFGPAPIFLANFREEFDKTTDEHGIETDHARKGQLRQRYVKKMIPNTAHLHDINCQFMVLFCHVYVYNPAVNANGALRFVVRTTDAVQRTESRCVEVAEDTCPTVLRFGCASMQQAHETELEHLEHAYRIVLRIEFFGETQRCRCG
jgi:hypothetical protein